MKVCHLTSLHSPFDVRIFYKECRSLARAGYDVTLIAPASFREESVEGVRVLGVPPATGRRERWRVWRNLVQTVRRLEADVIHFHDPELLLLTPFLGRAHLIYDCHEFNALAMQSKPWLPRWGRRPAGWLVARLEPALARRCSAVVLVNEAQEAIFRRTGRPLAVVRNFPLVPPSLPLRRDGDGRTVVHVGAHARTRGCSVMVAAFAEVVRRIPAARLWLVGPFNHPPYRAETEQLIGSLGLRAHVRMVGEVSYPVAMQWMRRADVGLVAIQPTPQYRHCLPTKLLEYMAAGVPVVAGETADIGEVVRAWECGILVPPDDPPAYGQAIVYLLTHPHHARQLGRHGWMATQTTFNWQLEEKRLLALYSSLQPADVGSRQKLSAVEAGDKIHSTQEVIDVSAGVGSGSTHR